MKEINRVTDRFKKMCEVYKIFAKDWDCDLSDEAMQEMFEYESLGVGNISIAGFNVTNKLPNGFAVGKKWLNVQVSYWLEDCKTRGWFNVLDELYSDRFPNWWLDEIFKDYLVEYKKTKG